MTTNYTSIQQDAEIYFEGREGRISTLEQTGRATTQAVSRWHPTAAARVRARVRSYGICGGQSGTMAGFLRVFRFHLPIFIPSTVPQSPSSIIWGWYNRPIAAAVPSGLSLTPLRIIKKKLTLEQGRRHSGFLVGSPNHGEMCFQCPWIF
jgi:hypothetical protein